VYASGQAGVAGDTATTLADDLGPLFKAIVREVAPPLVRPTAPLQLLITNLDYDEHKGRIAIGRVTSGTLTRGSTVAVCKPGADPRPSKITEAFVYDNFSRVPVDEVGLSVLRSYTTLRRRRRAEHLCMARRKRRRCSSLLPSCLHPLWVWPPRVVAAVSVAAPLSYRF
jgi:GTP-binding protein